jgi:hypothetical protein
MASEMMKSSVPLVSRIEARNCLLLTVPGTALPESAGSRWPPCSDYRVMARRA